METYFRLGLAAPNSRIYDDHSFRACLGDYSHPICNFAMRLRLDPWAARRLESIAATRPAFQVYVLPEDQPSFAEELLVRAGFHTGYSLTTMRAEPRRSFGTLPEVFEAASDAARDRVAEFMTSQFFARQDGAFKERVRWSTFAARDVTLHYLSDRGRPAAAVMLSRTPGVLGIYNLCVASNRRSRGLGSSLLRWCSAMGRSEGRVLALQCEPSLEGWYASEGFRSVGRINVFSLSEPVHFDIMESGPES